MFVIALIGTFVCVVFFVRLVLGEGADSAAGHCIDYRIDATDDGSWRSSTSSDLRRDASER